MILLKKVEDFCNQLSVFSKLATLMFACLVFFYNTSAQEKLTDNDGPHYKTRSFSCSLKKAAKKVIVETNIDSIIVIDIRPDTSKFGYFKGADFFYHKYVFKLSLQAQLQEYYKKNIVFEKPDTAKPANLVIVIKKFWIAKSHSFNTVFDENETGSVFYLTAEFFYKFHNYYYPVYRFDSTYYFKRNPNTFTSDHIAKVLNDPMKNLNNYKPEILLKRTSFTGQYFDSILKAFQNTYVTRDLLQQQRGVYMSFAKFKNNQPTYKDYELSIDKATNVLRIKNEEGNWIPCPKAWGFSDGKNCYIRLGLNYFPLFKLNNSYELYGTYNIAYDAESINNIATAFIGFLFGPAIADIIRTEELKVGLLRPMQLDMEDGVVY
jgi:hypothetical protein